MDERGGRGAYLELYSFPPRASADLDDLACELDSDCLR